MKTKYSIFGIFLFIAFLCSTASAQNPSAEIKTFDDKRLKFTYPADWTLTDKSTNKKQYLLLSKEQTTALIGIDSHRDRIVSMEKFRALKGDTEKAYFKAISDSLSTTYQQRVDREYFCLDFNGRNVVGERLVGLYKNEPSKGEFYSFILGGRLLTLYYLRTDKEAAKIDPVWQELIKSLSLEGSNNDAAVSFFEPGVINEGHLNSRAAFLKRPSYPADARKAGADGLVLVEIEIDEKGELLSSKAISGHRMLRASAESAVRQSKFKPTTGCGKPIKIKGTISYNFVL